MEWSHAKSDSSLMEKIETLQAEKMSLEMTIAEMTAKIEIISDENQQLKVRCDSLEKSLDDERRGKSSDKKVLNVSLFEGNDREGTWGETGSPEFYIQIIADMSDKQKELRQEIADLKLFYEEDLSKIRSEAEGSVKEIVECSTDQIDKVIREQEQIVAELLSDYHVALDLLRQEFENESKNKLELKQDEGKGIVSKLKALPENIRIAIVAGIVAIRTATAGWAGWGFINWIWTRLVTFAKILVSNPEGPIATLFQLGSSPSVQNFTAAWARGEPLGLCMKELANAEFLSLVTRVVPQLIKQFTAVPADEDSSKGTEDE